MKSSLPARIRRRVLTQVICVILTAVSLAHAQTEGLLFSGFSGVNVLTSGLIPDNFSAAPDTSSTELSSAVKEINSTPPVECKARVIVNISLATLTAAGLAGFIVSDIRSRQLAEEFDRIYDTRKATSNEIEWERMRAKRNIFGALTLGSASVLAVSFVIPVGRDSCRGCMEKSLEKRSTEKRKEEKKVETE